MQQSSNIEAELNHAYRALRILSASNRTLLRATDESTLLDAVCRIATEIGGYSLSWVGFKEYNAGHTVRPVAHCGNDSGFLDTSAMSWEEGDRGHSAISTAIRTGTIQLRLNILNDPSLSPWHDDARSRNYQSAIALPLQVDGQVIGAIAIYAPEPNAFTEAEVKLLDELACDLSFGIQTIRLRSAHEEANARIERLAFFDSLTGLPNRIHLTGLLAEALAEAKENETPLGLLLLDLDYIREINETYGHAAGDGILVTVADRLSDLAGDNCVITRFGGDDFIIICNGKGADFAATIAGRIVAAIRQPILLDARSFSIEGSIGIAMFPDDAGNASDLLARADLAMSKVKRTGGGYKFYKPEMTQALTRKLNLLQRLERCIADENLQLYYQPKVELYAGMIVGAEALLRWHDPVLGWVSPAEFVAIAEGRGLMTHIGEWVLKTACQHIRMWQNQGLVCPGRIAVNVSAKQFEDRYLVERVARILEQTGVSASCIELELTESCLLDDPDRMFEIMSALRWLGFSIAIDDFGTGYSSLAYLKRFPIDTLKIDQTFVRNMLEDRNDKAIISSILAIAQHMGLITVAEGVEQEKQRQVLKELGCVLAQGYYFCRPEPMEDFAAKLSAMPCLAPASAPVKHKIHQFPSGLKEIHMA